MEIYLMVLLGYLYIIVLHLLPKRHPTEKKPIKANYFLWVYGEVTGIEILITSIVYSALYKALHQ